MLPPMKPEMMEEEAPVSSPLVAALEQAQAALDEAIVQATMKKREAPEVKEEAAPVPTEEE